MNEYEEPKVAGAKCMQIRREIDCYLMERFKYRLSLVYLTSDNIIICRRNSRVNLYLRIRRMESLFPTDCLIIARIGFTKERIGHGAHFVQFLTRIAMKYGFAYIGIESTNEKSKAFAEKLGFRSIDISNYVASVEDLVAYFSREE